MYTVNRYYDERREIHGGQRKRKIIDIVYLVGEYQGQQTFRIFLSKIG